MSTRDSRIRLALAIAFLLVAIAPHAARAQLSADGTHGFANAYGTNDPADVSTTPGPDGLDVSMGAAATKSAGLSLALWQEDFTWEATLLGTGTVDWGVASASLALTASATPQLVYATQQGNGPLANNGNAVADGIVSLQFTDTAPVTSETLPPGTPVTLTFHFAIDSSDTSVGAGPDSFVGSSFSGTIRDLSVGVPDLTRLVLGNQQTSATFDTAVGHELRIEGRLLASGEAYAGYRACCVFAPDVQLGTAATSGGLWVSLPEDVELIGESSHDYTPEPGAGAAGAAALLALAAARRRRLRARPNRGAPGAARARETRS